MKSETRPTSVDLKDFFSATEARQDRWQQLNKIARTLNVRRPGSGGKEQAAKLLDELEPLESYCASPGPERLVQLRDLLARGHARER
jgi:hypothetical protein